jgi:hypothetical protein
MTDPDKCRARWLMLVTAIRSPKVPIEGLRRRRWQISDTYAAYYGSHTVDARRARSQITSRTVRTQLCVAAKMSDGSS